MRELMRRRWLRFAITVVVTAVLLYLVLKAIEPGTLGATMRKASLQWLPVAALGALLFSMARAWRFGLLLGGDRIDSRPRLFLITLASWGMGLVLPGLTSDGTFVWLARTQLGVPITLGAGAAIVGRLLDIVSLILIALLTAPLAHVILPATELLAGVALGILLLLALAAFFWHRPRVAIVTGLTRLPLAGGLIARMEPAIHELGGGSRPVQLILATLVARAATAVQYMALFAAIHQGLTFVQVWFALSIRTLLLAVPVQGIGGLGTSQIWWTAALRLLGRPFSVALPASLAVHLLDLSVSVPLTAAGAIALYFVRRRQALS